MSNWSLFVKNPVSDAEKSITGTIDNKNQFNKLTVFGTVNGFPKPFTTNSSVTIDGKSAQEIVDIGEFTIEGTQEAITPFTGDGPGSLKYAIDILLSEMAGIIDDIYGTTIGPRLVWEPAPEEPKQEEEPQTGTQSTPQSDPEPSNKQTSAIVDPKSINTKITLSVKSGPGVIIGITEKEVVNGEIDFSGLQFDKPGDYIIAVTPTSPDLDSTEFSITVLPEDELIEQDDSGPDEVKVEGDRPIIAQIRKPEVILPPIQYKVTEDAQQNTDSQGQGYMPFLWYNALQIPEKDIKSLELYHEGISPTVIVTFKDTLGIMKAEGAPLDDTKFEIFLNSGSENLKSIHLKFKIKTFQRKRKNYTISGSIDLPKFYEIAYKSYTGTSFDTFDMISKELKLGFNSNINNTKDSMKWTNTGMLFKDFVSNIIKHSYISDDSFVLGYIDHYWCFNYVDIEKEWNRDISSDVGVDSSGLSTQTVGKSDESKIIPLALSNEQSNQSNNLYFSSYKISNNSTSQSLKKGQFTITKYYDSNKKIMQIFKIDSLTTKKDDVVSLKGAPGDEKSFKENYRTNFLGRVDMDNVHENYLYSETQNRINLDNMVKITAELQLPQPNFNIYKYQKIQVNFTNTKRTPQTETTESYLDERMSGEWLIIDIRYSWRSGKLTQKVKIARKELGKLNKELDIPTKAKEGVDNAETNDNPVEEPKPNEVYNIGESYRLSDGNGKIYELIVSSLSDDGKEVVGELIDVSD